MPPNAHARPAQTGYNSGRRNCRISRSAGRLQNIADWLGQLGLEQYAQRFAENEIDVSVLRHLTDQDLKDIGVPLGHRRKILAAIAELNDRPAPTSTAPPGIAVAPPPPPAVAVPQSNSAAPEAAAERRYLTVLFCDLVGSTGIAAKLDAEECAISSAPTSTLRRLRSP